MSLSSPFKKSLSKDLFIFLLIFIVFYFIAFLALDVFVYDAIVISIFGDTGFSQMVFGDIFNYFYILISVALFPYLILLLSIILIVGIVNFARKEKYQMRRLMLLIFISFALAIGLHLIIVIGYINENLNILIVEEEQVVTLDNFGQAVLQILKLFLLEDYKETDSIVSMLGYYLVVKFTKTGSPLIYSDSLWIFLYFLIIFSVLFLFFNKSCECQLTPQSVREKTVRLKNKKKPNKNPLSVCSRKDIIVFITIVIIAIVPLINLVQLFVNQSDNLLVWENYFDDPNEDLTIYTNDNSSRQVTYDLLNLTLNITQTPQNPLGSPNEFPLYIANGMQTFLSPQIGEEFVYSKLYDFGSEKPVNYITFNQFFLGSNLTEDWFGNGISNPNGLVLNNATDFWDKLSFYVYVVKADNITGFGYRLNLNQTLVPTNLDNYTFYEPTLDSNINLEVFDLDIGAFEEEYELFAGTYRTFVRSKNNYLFDLDFSIGVDNIVFPDKTDFLPLHTFQNWEGYFEFLEEIDVRYFGIYLKLDETADVDFDNDGFNEILELFEFNAFVGSTNNIEDVTDSIIVLDIVFISISIVVIGVFYILEYRNKETRELKISCQIKKLEDRTRFDLR